MLYFHKVRYLGIVSRSRISIECYMAFDVKNNYIDISINQSINQSYFIVLVSWGLINLRNHSPGLPYIYGTLNYITFVMAYSVVVTKLYTLQFPNPFLLA